MTTSNWTTQQTLDLYNVSGWGSDYFNINDLGHLEVCLQNERFTQKVDLYDLIKNLQKKGIQLPVLLRFTDIIHHRLETLNSAFSDAIQKYAYKGNYTAVYPIKVNQQFSVVREVSEHRLSPSGLEAGTKTELIAVLALCKAKSTPIVCNGYKDSDYIRIALMAQQLGIKVYIVIEKLSELARVALEARNLNVTPLLGVRVRLSAAGSGKWQNSGGIRSKFGLSSGQLIELVDEIRKNDLVSSLQLLHFHLGSQITDINDIEKSMAECGHYLVEMIKLRIPIDTIDVGGGLGVDYDGTTSHNYFSMNYSVNEYAATIVRVLKHVCTQTGIKQPNLISESGRAITAHHAVLITNVIDVEKPPYTHSSSKDENSENADILLLAKYIEDVTQNQLNPVELLHKASTQIEKINTRFSEGLISIKEKFLAEKYFFKVCKLVQDRLISDNDKQTPVLNQLNEKLAHKYFCNFSLFQSLPDIWAINQIFPIMPLNQLNKQPDQQGVLFDITCDSDGRIDHYVNKSGVQSTLPLHKYDVKTDYYLGMFLVGAYQEILGDMHNLFGDTNTVNVVATEDGYSLTDIQQGESVDYLLNHIHYNTDTLLHTYRSLIDKAELTSQQREDFFHELKNKLKAYTYLI